MCPGRSYRNENDRKYYYRLRHIFDRKIAWQIERRVIYGKEVIRFNDDIECSDLDLKEIDELNGWVDPVEFKYRKDLRDYHII